MQSTGIQAAFFQHLKNLIPPNKSMVDEIAEILNISNDSAYRRIRTEKPISLEEIQKLAEHYKVSLDQFMHLQNDSFIFTGHLTNASDHLLEQWMEETYQQLLYINSFSHKHLYYHARDITHLYYFGIPEVWAFKSFVWKKSILIYDHLKGVKFSTEKHIEESGPQLAVKITNLFNQVPGSDIWNIDCINTALGQIEFYRDAEMFETKKDFENVCHGFLHLIEHLEKQAELGLKFKVGESNNPGTVPFHLYYYELSLGDNSAFVELDDTKISFINHSGINFIMTRDKRFTNHINQNLKTLIQKSTKLSAVGEKDRIVFFSRLRDRIKAVLSS